MNEFDWIVFDCFNTLIDDFDQAGDESGLGPMEHYPNFPLYHRLEQLANCCQSVVYAMIRSTLI